MKKRFPSLLFYILRSGLKRERKPNTKKENPLQKKCLLSYNCVTTMYSNMDSPTHMNVI